LARLRSITSLAVVLATIGGARPAFAADPDADANRAQTEVTSVDRESSSVQAAIEKAKSARYTVEQRLTNGELLYRTKDYPRAVVILSEILE
jgi:hypothetical protein